MPTRREQLFKANRPAVDPSLVSTKVSFAINPKTKTINKLSLREKMLCALRKMLTVFSDSSEEKCRYFIDGDKLQVLEPPVSVSGNEDGGGTYQARGRCRLGATHKAGHASHMVIEFLITFRDAEDANGIATVDYIEPSTIDKLPLDAWPPVSA